MSEHWNVQIKVQRVDRSASTMGGERREVTEVLSLAVVADSEREAYAKVVRVLDIQGGGK